MSRRSSINSVASKRERFPVPRPPSPRYAEEKEESGPREQALKEQMLTLKVRCRELSEELVNVKTELKHEKTDLRVLKGELTDYQHDIEEIRRVRDRLDKENDLLKKKLRRREAERAQLRNKVETLNELLNDKVGNEHPVVKEIECNNMVGGGDDGSSPMNPAGPMNWSRGQSLWNLLKNEEADSRSGPSMFSRSASSVFSTSIGDLSMSLPPRPSTVADPPHSHRVRSQSPGGKHKRFSVYESQGNYRPSTSHGYLST